VIAIVSYLCLFVVSVVVMIVTDDDPRSVSLYEWVLFAVMLYSAVSIVRRLLALHEEE